MVKRERECLQLSMSMNVVPEDAAEQQEIMEQLCRHMGCQMWEPGCYGRTRPWCSEMENPENEILIQEWSLPWPRGKYILNQRYPPGWVFGPVLEIQLTCHFGEKSICLKVDSAFDKSPWARVWIHVTKGDTLFAFMDRGATRQNQLGSGVVVTPLAGSNPSHSSSSDRWVRASAHSWTRFAAQGQPDLRPTARARAIQSPLMETVPAQKVKDSLTPPPVQLMPPPVMKPVPVQFTVSAPASIHGANAVPLPANAKSWQDWAAPGFAAPHPTLQVGVPQKAIPTPLPAKPSAPEGRGLGRGLHMTRPFWMTESGGIRAPTTQVPTAPWIQQPPLHWSTPSE
jgi:hypothetical protein